jgi:hypothetical protein
MTDSARRAEPDWLKPRRIAPAAVVVGLASAIQSFAMSRMRSASVTLPNELTVHLTFWLVWALCVPVVVRGSAVIARLPRSVPTKLACHLLAGTVLSLFNATVVYGMRMALGFIAPPPPLWRAIAGFASWQLSADLLAYGLIASGYHLSRSYAEGRDREILAGRLRAELASARLAALRGQLHPHFLFNTLNSISTLVQADPLEARRAVTLLSDLLRLSLSAPDRDWLSLRDELRFAELYLAIERIRYGERLTVEFAVEDPTLDGTAVPSFVLVPLVENAVKYGVARNRGAARVRVEASRHDGLLVLAVTNTGSWVTERSSTGTGLVRLRRRLAELYDEEAELTTESTGTSVCVSVSIPVHSGAVERDG